MLKLWSNHNTKSCFQLANLLTWENLGSNPNHMEDLYTLQFSLYWSNFPFLSRPNYFSESHLFWMRTWELPVHNSARKFSAQLHPHFLLEHAASECIRVTSRTIPDTVLWTYVSRQAAFHPILWLTIFNPSSKKQPFDHSALVPLLISTAWVISGDDTAWGFHNNSSNMKADKKVLDPHNDQPSHTGGRF